MDFCDDWILQDVVTNYTFSDDISLPEEFLPIVDKQKALFGDIVTNTTSYPDTFVSNLPLHTTPNLALLEDNNVAQQTVDIKTEHKDKDRKREKRRKGSGKAETTESPSLDAPISPLPPSPVQTAYFEVMAVQIARNNGLYHDTNKSQIKIRIDSSFVPKNRWIRGSVEMELLHS